MNEEAEEYMNARDGSEQAYKNGYEAGVKEFAERLKAVGNKRLWICAINETDIDTVVNELTEGKE